MDLAPYVEDLRRELAVAAQAGGADALAWAERLVGPLESAIRLALLEALSAAADEISRELAPGSVDVRLRGRDADFVVTPPPTPLPTANDVTDGATWSAGVVPARAGISGGAGIGGGAGAGAAEGDEGRTSRLTLRVPEQLKPRIDEAADREGLSVNAWLVRAVGAALDPGAVPGRPAAEGADQHGRRYRGWVR
ncbi:toxin-antitoxin system HicB family antitoxin [Frankia sp. AiPs1]|uniref:toxin-antitoxin system HicB family antitoxin n=1 Tax=Frankia sp. AiPs1 TaxID=573493 RepID=UPI002043B270|nr:toxin-antitoxin system HicB family antitoxin [Frankia sp. AiPs1]MCM3923757.1 toxin-antitoxin system HicB family antitoxin [Frankia sp. AiPs1]